jgi:hypothetical protein
MSEDSSKSGRYLRCHKAATFVRPGVLLAAVFGFSVSAFGQTVDPVGFCPPPATACFTGTGFGSETISVGTTQFDMEKNGNSASSKNPWFLLIAVPEAAPNVATAPTITSTIFTQNGSTKDVGTFTPTTSGSIYTFAGLIGASSMNATNLFGSNEIFAAGGSAPKDFEIFEYSFSPAFVGGFTPYLFTVGGSGLVNGTYLAASGGSHKFSTPYTVTGLVNGPGGNGNGQGQVPEPSSIILLGTVSLFVLSGAKKALNRR